MAKIEFDPGILDDFDRFFEHWSRFGILDGAARIAEIVEAIQVLRRSPLIGRPVRQGARELVIGQDARGYVALYRYMPDIDTVFILAIRGQREARYSGKH